MKWSRMSLGRQIAVIALALLLLLVAILLAYTGFTIRQARRAWMENTRLIHQEAERILTDALEDIRLAAYEMLNASGLEETEQQSVRDFLLGRCPSLADITVQKINEEARADRESGYSSLMILPETSAGRMYGFLYTCRDKGMWAQAQVRSRQLSDRIPLHDGVRVMLLDSRNQVTACSAQSLLGTYYTQTHADTLRTENGLEYCQYVTEGLPDGYRIVTLASGAALRQQRVTAIIPVSVAALLVVVAALVASFTLIHLSVARPISQMSETLVLMRKRPETRLSMILRGNREMQELGHSFNRMMDENERLNAKLVEANVRLYQAELIRKQTDMAMLVSQINPHFLYNTLAVIKGMAYKAGARSLADMTGALSSVFRYCLKAPEIVTLEQEMDILKKYLMIQQTRFGDRFRVFYDVPEALLQQNVPKMILQPLCENAVTHGLEMMEKGGELRVSAALQGSVLELTVEDNGLGIEEDTLRRLREKLNNVNDIASFYEAGADGIGVVNVHGRIRMRYGEAYGLSIDSQAGRGTRVVLRMPGRRPQDCIKY